MKNKKLLSGNQAIALASVAAKVDIVTGYPGTPSTEIIDTLLKNQTKETKTSAHWAINEKVALEMAIGANIFGKRAVCTMKHVGLNVAADALMTFSYAGTNAGCLIVSGDDPNMYSSQNEQDNRNYAYFAKIPMLEPSDSHEAFLFTLIGLEISEALDTPILLRITTRVAHSVSLVDVSPARTAQCIRDIKKCLRPYLTKKVAENKNWVKKSIMLPSIGRIRHQWVEERIEILKKITEHFAFNRLEKSKSPAKNKKLLVTSGVSYLYCKDAFPEYDVYKISLSYPMPTKVIKKYAKSYAEVIAVEELDPFIENQLLIAGIPVRKRHYSFYCGELSIERVKELVRYNKKKETKKNENSAIKDFAATVAAIPNPPALCSGCPHLTIANLLRKENLTVSGDIGCYTLSALPPFNAIDAVLSMGSSIGMLSGMNLAYEKGSTLDKPAPKIAIIGDSTFLHAGMPALIEIARGNPDVVICLLDNRTTAMTGQQEHPGTKIEQEDNIDYVKLAQALGVKQTYRVASYRIEHARMILQRSLKEKGVTFIVFEESCALLKKRKEKESLAEIRDICVRCGECLEVGCPSISFDPKKQRPDIQLSSCIGCGVCFSSCHYHALGRKKERNLFDFIEK